MRRGAATYGVGQRDRWLKRTMRRWGAACGVVQRGRVALWYKPQLAQDENATGGGRHMESGNVVA